jgi:DNA-binding IclR family transcriptional regulator
MEKEEILKIANIFKCTDSKKVDVIYYILKNMDKNNEIKTDLRSLSKLSKSAYLTVFKIIDTLKNEGYLTYCKDKQTYKINL